MGPVVRQGDDVWFNIVKWSLNAMINAEEMGITSGNINAMTYNKITPAEARFIGKEGKFGEELGLASDWAYQIIKQVGNYNESYEKHLGLNTPLLLARGANALWTDGGILYAPPIR